MQDSHDRETYETCPKCDYNTTKTEKMDKHMRKAHEMVGSHNIYPCIYGVTHHVGSKVGWN